MPILRIKLLDAAGTALAGQSINVSNCEELQSNADGIAQFLLGEAKQLNIDINGKSVWTGDPGQLSKDETFQQSAAGFVRQG